MLLIENVPTMADVEVEVEEKGKKETNWKDVERELLIALHVWPLRDVAHENCINKANILRKVKFMREQAL